jgi:transcriptional regulatory protein LevR
VIIPQPAGEGNPFVLANWLDAATIQCDFSRLDWVRFRPVSVMTFPRNVLKMRQTETLLATIGTDDWAMRTLAVISILALLTITGAAFTDQLLTRDRETVQQGN